MANVQFNILEIDRYFKFINTKERVLRFLKND